ncbi:Uncharacterised protein [uncultured archaeon]|nr:Uncharacterised protein [uncultured archaeon]
MDRDTIIAVVLGIGLFFAIFALFGILAVTGYFYVSGSAGQDANNGAGQASLAAASGNAASDANAPAVKADSNVGASPSVQPSESPKPKAPVCGNSVIESGEVCETDADCDNAGKLCKSCKCEDKPKPAAPKLDKLALSGIFFDCKNYNGKRGLSAKIFTVENNGDSDFTYSGRIDINATIGDWTDTVSTLAMDITAKTGKTFDIYPKDIDRQGNPFVFLGNKANVPMTIRLSFGDKGYLEDSRQLAFQNFMDNGCA